MSTPATESGTSAASNQTLYLGLGVGVGGLLLVAIIAIIIQIVRKTKQHNRRTQGLEEGQVSNVTAEIRQSSDIRRTLSIGRRATVHLSNEKAPWNPLASTETLEPAPAKKRLRSIRLPKRSKKDSIKLKSIKHLSAIAESPRSRAGHSPNVANSEHHEMLMEHGSWPVMITRPKDAGLSTSQLSIVEQADATSRPQSSQPEGSIIEDDRPKAPRSVSMGALVGTTLQHPLLTPSLSVRRLKHARSASLGDKPPEHLPPDPVPSLPVISPHRIRNDMRTTSRSSMSSVSSDDSASSSVLISSPSFRRYATPNQAAKPGMRQAGSTSDVQTPFVFPKIRNSVELGSNALRISMPDGKRVLASLDSSSSLDQENNLIHTSSTTSANSRAKRAKLSPSSTVRGSMRRPSRSSVSVDGSPAERKKVGVLRDISGNASVISRHSSNGTQHSPNSSEGNPFQWDSQSLTKPSAMKGSPNARKGHRRVNCVRISTLTPQVLGPPPSRPESPSITHRIDEESSTDENGRITFVTNRRPSRPSSTLGLGSQLRVQALRASCTPSSPTLSWTTFHDPHIPSQPSDSHLTVSSGGFSRPLSGVSSNFSIPSFPSPSRITMTEVQRSEPVPEFCVSKPSFEDDRAPSPLDPFSVSSMHLSSSPPSPWTSMYEPAWTTNGAQGSASSGASLRDLSTNIPMPSPLFRQKLTSENASSVMANLPSALFPGAPVLRPTSDSAAIETSEELQRSSTPVQQQEVTLRVDASGRNAHRDISPAGPRQEPGRSVYKTAMALRRMNSEIDTTNCRESRRYLQFGREPSPQLGFFPSPNPSEQSNERFDFEFDKSSQGGDTVIMTSPSTNPGSGNKRLSSQKTYPKSILKNRNVEESVWNSSPLAIKASQMSDGVQKSTGISTPNSLYDADGFLR